MKRITSAVSAALVVLSSLAIPAYAASISYKSVPNFTKYLSVDASGNAVLNVFGIAGLDQSKKDIWIDIMNTFEGKNDRLPFFIYLTSPAASSMQFLSFDAASFTSSSRSSNGKTYISYRSSLTHFVSFLYDSETSSWKYYSSGSYVDNSTVPFSESGSGSLVYYVMNVKGVPLHSSVTEISDVVSLRITDDIEDPKPTPPPPPPYVPADPVIPPGNSEYVPYDTSIWKKFLDHIRFNIGSSTSIGLLIFGAIAGIWLIKKIISYFSK